MPRPSEQLKRYIEGRIKAIKAGASGELSEDGAAVVVAGGLGYSVFVSPEGSAFVAHDDDLAGKYSHYDRSIRGQIEAISLGMRHLPMLAELLPPRTTDAVTCENCSGKGWTNYGFAIPGDSFLCRLCCGLGWTSPTVFSGSDDTNSAQT